MQYCYHYPRYREQEWLALELTALFLYLFVNCLVSLAAIKTFMQGMIYVCCMIICLSVACFMLMAYLEIRREYAISNEGITLSYPFHFVIMHTWDELSEIGICNVHYTTRGSIEYLTVIRCVIGEENNGPAKGHGWWADSFYSAIHFRKIINIVFSEERIEEFRQICPIEIVDYRGIKQICYSRK